MRAPRRFRALGIGLVAATAVGVGLVGACAEKKSGLMLAITTDMKAPKDVNAVSVTIATNGTIKHSFIGRVTPQGEVELPATLAVVQPDDPNAVIRIRVMAFQDRKPRVLRDVRTSIPAGGRTGLLRIPLNFVNDGSTKGPLLPDGVLPAPKAGVGVKDEDPTGNATGFDFLSSYQPECADVLNQTWIDGECKDNAVDFASLPDFDPALVGSSTDSSCFDVATCLKGASPVGQGRLDATACTLAPPEGGAGSLNLALVTAETGECIAPGECYIPIDRSASGWREEGGRVKLTAGVCRLVAGGKAKLYERAGGACKPKEEASPICRAAATPADGGADGGRDDGATGEAPTLVVSADYPTTVGVLGDTLYFAGADKIGSLSLEQAGSQPTIFNGADGGVGGADGGAPSGRRPYRIGVGNGAVGLADGTRTGYLLSPSAMTPISFEGGGTGSMTASDVAVHYVSSPPGPEAHLLWSVTDNVYSNVPQSAVALSAMGPLPPNFEPLAIGARDNVAIVGGVNQLLKCSPGSVTICDPSAITLSGTGRFNAITFAVDSGGTNGAKAWILSERGVYRFPDPANRAVFAAVPLGWGSQETTRLQDGESTYARAIAADTKCVYFSGAAGLHYASVGVPAKAGTVTSNGKVLGVAVGREAGTSRAAIYFTVFAPVAPGANGGGVYRSPIPPDCASP